MFKYIQRVRREIAALNQSSDGVDKFETMDQQLDGIVEATKDATDTVINAVEKNNEALDRLQQMTSDKVQLAPLSRIAENNNAVFEACAFQVLTASGSRRS